MSHVLRYGRTGLDFDLPAGLSASVLHLNPLPGLEDEDAAVRHSLQFPIGSLPLVEIARGRRNACIVVSDVTRPVPNAALLHPILETLHAAGLEAADITLLVATGLHRPNLGAELEEMIGADIVSSYRVINHMARESADMVDIGTVEFSEGRSAQVALNRHYVEADLKITTGLIEPHFMAGYSGGRKLVCPGIASAETILQFHAPPMIAHHGARAGNLADNPIHAMSRAVAGKVGCDFICNVTLNEDRRITGVFSGDLDAAHLAGTRCVDRGTKVSIGPAPIVVTTGAGYPLDTTFYQCIKGMVGALPALLPGGTLIVASSLSQGVGSEEFTAMCHTLTTVDDFMDRIFNSPVEIDQWQLQEMMKVLRHAGEIMMVTDGLDAATQRNFLLSPYPTVESALAVAHTKHGDSRVVIIPEGPYVTPVAEITGTP